MTEETVILIRKSPSKLMLTVSQCYVSLQNNDIINIPDHGLSRSPMTLASSSVSVLLRYVFFTRSVFPEGKVQPVLGMGGSPSFCCSLSAMTRNALRPIFILCRTKKFYVQLFVIKFQILYMKPLQQRKSIVPTVTRAQMILQQWDNKGIFSILFLQYAWEWDTVKFVHPGTR